MLPLQQEVVPTKIQTEKKLPWEYLDVAEKSQRSIVLGIDVLFPDSTLAHCETVSEALAIAKEGCVLRLFPGIYREQHTLRIEKNDITILCSQNMELSCIVLLECSESVPLIEVCVDNFTMIGIQLSCSDEQFPVSSKEDFRNCIRVVQGSPLFERCKIFAFKGISVLASENSSPSLFQNCVGTTVMVVEDSQPIFIGNRFKNNFGYDVVLRDSCTGRFERNLFYGTRKASVAGYL
eukprot:747091-Hanusia_phi.AAC.6